MQGEKAQKKLDLLLTLLIDRETNANGDPVTYCMFENLMRGGNPGNCLSCRFVFGGYCLLHLMNGNDYDITDVMDGITEAVKTKKVPKRFMSSFTIAKAEEQAIINAERIVNYLPKYPEIAHVNTVNTTANRFSDIDIV